MQISRFEFSNFAELKARLATVTPAQVLYLRRTASGTIQLGISDTVNKVMEKKSIQVPIGDPTDSELAYIGRGVGFTVVESIGFSTDDIHQLVDAFDTVINGIKTRDVYTADSWRRTNSVVYRDNGVVVDTHQATSVRAMGSYILAISDNSLVAADVTKWNGWEKLEEAKQNTLGGRMMVCQLTPNARLGRPMMFGGPACWKVQIFDQWRVYGVILLTTDHTFTVTDEEIMRSFPIGMLGGDPSNGQAVSVEPKLGNGVVEVKVAHRGR